jgi:hypothetical protein
MEQQKAPATAPQSETPVTQQLPYEPPKATFVPLKIEERLLTCSKVMYQQSCVPVGGPNNQNKS